MQTVTEIPQQITPCKYRYPGRPAVQFTICKGCNGPTHPDDWHRIWKNRCDCCGLNLMEDLFARIIARHGKRAGLARLKALADVD